MTRDERRRAKGLKYKHFRSCGLAYQRRVDGQWGRGDAAWVNEEGRVYFAVLKDNPYPCDDGVNRVIVRPAASPGKVRIVRCSCLFMSQKEASGSEGENPLELRVDETAKPCQRKPLLIAEVCLCYCGCGKPLKNKKRRFLQGHDSKFHSRLKRLEDGRLTEEELHKEVGAYAVSLYLFPVQR